MAPVSHLLAIDIQSVLERLQVYVEGTDPESSLRMGTLLMVESQHSVLQSVTRKTTTTKVNIIA